MGILQAPAVNPGQVGTIGAIKYMVSTDNLTTITTAGYLNQIDLAVNPILPSDILGITYGFSTVTNSGSFGLFSVSLSNGVITLAEQASSGINLPTIANHIATYTNTTGTLSEDPATAISGGNIQAGLSGTAGTLASFPATASNGSLIVKAINNTGGFNSTLSNSNIAQDTVYSLPDTTSATANVLAAGGALVSGNIVQASGTAGAVVDSGIPAANLVTSSGGVINTVSVTLLTAQVTTAFATPVQLIAAPGAGKVILIQEANVYTASTGNTAYATGTAPVIQYDSTVHGAGTVATSALATGDITAASSQIKSLTPPTGALTGITNKGIFFSNATNNYTAGTGTNIVISLTYQVVTATV